MTLLQLADGKEIRVSQSYEEVRRLLQEAQAADAWLELHGEDGLITGINPATVTYIQNSVAEGPGPGHEKWEGQRLTREGATA